MLLYRAPDLMQQHIPTANSLVLGSFADKAGSNHPAMWEMVLTYVRAFPSCWYMVDMRKAVLPKLYAFLRYHFCR